MAYNDDVCVRLEQSLLRPFSPWINPLRPLSTAEVKACTDLIKAAHAAGHFGQDSELKFVSVTLSDPMKQSVWRVQEFVDQVRMQPGNKDLAPLIPLLPPRRAFAVCSYLDARGVARPLEIMMCRVMPTEEEIRLEFGDPQCCPCEGDGDGASECSTSTVPTNRPPIRFIVEYHSLQLAQQPSMTTTEYRRCEELVKSSPMVMAALAKRGLSEQQVATYLMVDPWISFFDNTDQRVIRPLLFYKDYSRPIGGIDVVVDLARDLVVSVSELFPSRIPHVDPDTYEPVADPLSEWRWMCHAAADHPHVRKTLKPLHITQPDGVSYVLNRRTRELMWQKWHFTIGFNSRDGLVLYNVRYFDDGCRRTDPSTWRWRNVFFRGSVCEMVVPYGDPKWPNPMKNAFDAGEDGLGRNANSLTLGCDCSGVIAYLDATLVTEGGDLEVVKNAICIHEEDFGVVMKHTDWRTGEGLSRRSRRLVVSFFTTVANYDYGFFWYFYTDGTIQQEVKLTGQLSTSLRTPTQLEASAARKANLPLPPVREKDEEETMNAVDATPVTGFGTLLTPEGLYAPVHQHFFCARIDWTVDGDLNAAEEVNVVRVGEFLASPHGQKLPIESRVALNHANWHRAAFMAVSQRFRNEREARRNLCTESARVWKVVNDNVRNRTGAPVAWKLIPGLNSRAMQEDEALVSQRAGFTRYHVWVTPFHHEELYPAGDYPMNRMSVEGLLQWSEKARPIVNKDIVMWYSFCVSHVPRLEDWPIMPVEYASFELKPFGFFDHAPSSDVPPSSKHSTASQYYGEPSAKL